MWCAHLKELHDRALALIGANINDHPMNHKGKGTFMALKGLKVLLFILDIIDIMFMKVL